VTLDIALVLALAAGSVILFVSERFRVDLVALILMCSLMLLGLVDPVSGVAGFSNPATLTVGAMFVLSQGLQFTGALKPVGRWLVRLMEKSVARAEISLMVVTGSLSAFINNTAAVAILLPVILASAKRLNKSPARLLMGLSFASMFGGVCTLIGTSTNLLVSAISEAHGYPPLSMFELAPLGLTLFVAGVVYMSTFGFRLVPERKVQEFTDDYELGTYISESLEPVSDKHLYSDDTLLVEASVGPASGLAGSSLEREGMGPAKGAQPLAIRKRDGTLLHDDLARSPLKSGDVVLFRVFRDRLERLRMEPAIVLPPEELPPRDKRWTALSILIGVVLLAATGLVPILVSATSGCVAMVLTGCITLEEAYRTMEWKVLVLLAGMLALGVAMETSGAATYLASGLMAVLGEYGPHTVLGGLYLATVLLTAMMSNNATAVLLAPIALALSHELGVDARPLLVAVTVGASSCFLTPIGYQTNAMIYGPGRFRFSDFLRVGGPLNLIFAVISVVLIPWIWPF
jgi:di/tricarboxylate transporter